jgi:hypothetical protein
MPRSLVVIAALLLVAACGTSGSSDTSSVGSGASGSAAPVITEAPLTAVQVHELVQQAVRQGNSGRFRQEAVFALPDGSLTREMTGVFDLSAGRWAGRMSFASDSAEFKKSEPNMKQLVVNFRYADSRVYMTLPAWPPAIRGRWLAVSREDLRSIDSMSDTPAIAPAVAVPLAMAPVGVERTASGFTLAGTLPASQALPLLFSRPRLEQAGVKVDDATTSANVTVQTDPDGLPLSVLVSGKGLGADTSLPGSYRQLIENSEFRATLSGFGSPVTVKVPTAGQLVDPREMKPPS